MSDRGSDKDESAKMPPEGERKADSAASVPEFSYSRSLTEKSARKAFSEGMDAAGMALSLRALEERESPGKRPSPESFVQKILEERAAAARNKGNDKGRG